MTSERFYYRVIIGYKYSELLFDFDLANDAFDFANSACFHKSNTNEDDLKVTIEIIREESK